MSDDTSKAPDPSIPTNDTLHDIIRGVVREEFSADKLMDPQHLPDLRFWLPSFVQFNRIQHGHSHRNDGDDPIPMPTGIEFAAGNGTVNSTTAGADGTPVFVDISQMITNAPDVFGLNVSTAASSYGSTWSSSSTGLEVLQAGAYRIWMSQNYTSVYSVTSVSATSAYGAAGAFFFQNWYAFNGDEHGPKFQYVNFGSHPVSVAPQFTTTYSVDFVTYVSADPNLNNVVVSTVPFNVIPFGLVHNFGAGGSYKMSFQIYKHDVGKVADDGDWTGITYLP